MPDRLSPERWRALNPHLERALELPDEERGPWLAALRQRDPALADDLALLLERRREIAQEAFLDAPAVVPAAPASLAGQAIGDYTLRSLLGQGGMGSVWLAERSDGRYQGQAAAKLLNASLVGRDGEARFKREGSILARLRHPHIAHLIDAGVSALGQPYLVLERVDGARIDRYCDERRLGLEARIRLFVDVLAAVAHAHANLVVHRDLKPSNVLVTTDGQVKLLDFGIAKLMETEATGELTALTREGGSALTPEYAAPEQLTGGDVTTATDVYALGVLLYLLLTGRHPAGAEKSTPAELVRAVVDTEPARASDAVTGGGGPEAPSEVAARRGTSPRKLRSALRGDLENILAKALKKRPGERYTSAEAMADDLRRYLDQRPVRARADSLGYRARKFVSRNRAALGAATVAALAIVIGAGLAVWQARVAARQRDRALVQLQRSEATNDFSSFLLSETRPSEGRPITYPELLARGEALIDSRFAGDPTLRVHMLLILADHYHESDQFDRWRQTLGRAFDLARGIPDVGLRARAECAKAVSLADKGDHTGADALFAEALAGLAALPDGSWDEARCRVDESIAAKQKGDLARAIASAERAIALEEARSTPLGWNMDAQGALADAYLAAGRFGSADRAFRKQVELIEAQGRGQTRVASTILNNWAVMLQSAGQHLASVPVAERAVRIARQQDTDGGAPWAKLGTYGIGLAAVGRSAEAIPILEEGVAKARSAGSQRRLFLALAQVSTAYREAQELEKAGQALQQAEDIVKADPAAPPQLYATLERCRARVAVARGQAVEGAELAARAVARLDAAHRPASELIPALLALAEAQNGDGRHDAALTSAGRALKLARERLGEMTHSTFVGQSHLERGVAFAGQGNLDAGRDDLRQALEHLRASVGTDAPSTRRAAAQLARLDPAPAARPAALGPLSSAPP